MALSEEGEKRLQEFSDSVDRFCEAVRNGQCRPPGWEPEPEQVTTGKFYFGVFMAMAVGILAGGFIEHCLR